MHARLKQPKIRFYLLPRLSNTGQLIATKKEAKNQLEGIFKCEMGFLTRNFKYKLDALFFRLRQTVKIHFILARYRQFHFDPLQLTWIVIRDAL